MLIIPAIDLLNGAVVRLKQGAEKTAKIYSTKPAEVAARWRDAGAKLLHVVDLDGAFGRPQANLKALEAVLQVEGISVELGGGIRSLEDARSRLDLGVDRVIFGTVAVKRPEIVEEAVRRFGPERVVVGIDGRQNRAAVQGWEEETSADVFALASAMKRLGVPRLIYTDVSRDGLLQGPNLEATDALARSVELKIIASGGFSATEHFEALAGLRNPYIEGAIVGTALYEGLLDAAELIARFQE